jgi:hypothetical protein
MGRKKRLASISINMGDILRKEMCPYDDICNYAKKCYDDDWENCGVYIHIKDMFDYHAYTMMIENSKEICD